METALVLKAKTRKEVAIEYGIEVRTLYRWLKKEDIRLSKGLIKPKHLKTIYETFGKPQILTGPEMS
jgi:DNA invertase Pin-like site-specific DNA recombinase